MSEDARRVRFVQPEEARARVLSGALLFDTRGMVRRTAAPVRGAVGFDWTRWRAGWLRTGLLPDDPTKLVAWLRKAGLRFDRPAVVAGAGVGGFGEEGRLAWTLAWLGHRRIAVLDRSIDALADAPERGPPGDLGPRPAVQPHLRATTAEVAAAAHSGAVVWDSRSPEEFAGATPYGEARGGHIPGAVHLHWKALFDEAGVLLDDARLRATLAAAGVPLDQPVVTTCSGGVRSAWAWCVLEHLGHPQARNYDGGMWAWSADDGRPVTAPGGPGPSG